MDLENKDTNIEKDTDTKENKTSQEETKETKVENEEVVSIKKADLDALLEKVGKITDIEKMLKQEQEEKKQLKFENLKQKHKLTDDICDLLEITADTKEEDVINKINKFNEIVVGGQQKDNAVFFKTDTTKTGLNERYDALIAKKDLKSAMAALAIRINNK